MKPIHSILLATTAALVLGSVLVNAAPEAGRPPAADEPKLFRVKVAGKGRPVIFIPGLTCDGSVWDATVLKFQDKAQCHVLSLAGFGSTPAVKGDSFLPAVRDEVIRYIKTHRLEKPVIVGHSLGGALGVMIASTEPNLIGRLVIMDSIPFLAATMNPAATGETMKPMAGAQRDQIAKSTPEGFMAYQKQTLPNMVNAPADAEKLAAVCGLSDPATTGQAIYELFTTDLRPEVAKIQCPTLVIAALKDKLMYGPREQIEGNYTSQYASLKGVRFLVLPEAKHFVMYDAPEAWYTALASELAAK